MRTPGAVGLEAVAGSLPVIGDAFDAWFKFNRRLVRLLRLDLERRKADVDPESNSESPS